MKDEKQKFETLPKPPAGEHVFEVKRAGVKDGAVWYALGNEQYELLQYVDLRKDAQFDGKAVALAAIIEQTIGYCSHPQQLVGQTVEVLIEVTDQGYANILAVRSVK